MHRVDGCLRETLLQDASWRYAPAASGCKYIEVEFDAVRRDIGIVIKTIADFMDVEIDAECFPTKQRTRSQASDVNDEWARRYIAEHMKNLALLSRGTYRLRKLFSRGLRKAVLRR
jgi:LPS sulfotransferase NodH